MQEYYQCTAQTNREGIMSEQQQIRYHEHSSILLRIACKNTTNLQHYKSELQDSNTTFMISLYISVKQLNKKHSVVKYRCSKVI